MKPSQLRTVGAVSAALALSALTACTQSDTTTAAGDSGPVSSEAQEALDKAYQGVTGTPPTTPAKPKPGVTLWVISCGEQVPSCVAPTAAAVEAGKAAGWTVESCDGQLNPDGWGSCIRQAASAGADVVIPIGIDCVAVQAPLQEAQGKGVTVIGGGGADCTAVGGPALFDTERLQLDGVSIEEYWKLNGEIQAAWLVGQADAKAKVLLLNFTDPVWGPWITEGFTAELATCEECEIVKTLDIANNDVATGALPTKFSSALLQATDANAVSIPIGGWLHAGVAQAIESSGRARDLAISSGFGDASIMELIRTSSLNLGALGYSSAWGAYGSVDEAIRVLNGDEPVVEGDGFQMVDKSSENFPASGDYTGGVDHKAVYTKLWGVS